MQTIDQLLSYHFGFDTFRPGQRETIEALQTHGRALAVFPTGSGKSLCYQLPALLWPGLTVVVSPLIALMKDQLDFLNGLKIPAAKLDGTMSPIEVREVNAKLRAGSLSLLYVAPERFANERFIAMLSRLDIALFAIDEAHCISEWGHNFRPDYLKLADFSKTINAERILALTATATPPVVDDICKAFGIPKSGAILTGFFRPNLHIQITDCSNNERDYLLTKRLKTLAPGTTIVYTTLQKTAERVASVLAEQGLPARAYHAGLNSEDRHQIQDWWQSSDKNIVVATIAFGMGIDKSDVRNIIHYNLPKSIESYTQEIGRAGRDGGPAHVELLFAREDIPVLKNFAYGDTPSYEAIHKLISQCLDGREELDISLYETSQTYDIRQLVVRTLLTYLELLGILLQGTPYYSQYQFRLTGTVADTIEAFPGEPGEFVSRVIDLSQHGRIWYTIDADRAEKELQQPRRRIVRCLEVLEERGLAEIRASEPKMRFSVLPNTSNVNDVSQKIYDRLVERETQEVTRVEQVVSLVTTPHCYANAISRHFGEIRSTPCGVCSFCLGANQQRMATISTKNSSSDFDLDWEACAVLRRENKKALMDARQMARFLCGLTSPAATHGKLTKHPMFGILSSIPFQTVLERVESLATEVV